jgi:hypothetical protein
MAEEPTQRTRSGQAADQIRDAAKWLIGAFAAVGAALIAGSQLSSIGKLTVCAHFTLECDRLWLALIGAAVGLGGVVWAIWIGVSLLTPDQMSPSALQREWDRGDKSIVRRFFEENRDYLQGFSDFNDIHTRRKEKYEEFDRLDERNATAGEGEIPELNESLEFATDEINELNARAESLLDLANQVHFTYYFRTTAIRKILLAATLAAVGIVVFAWAGNPGPAPKQVSAHLRNAVLKGDHLQGVNLRDAELRGANLSRADLTGADLRGADLEDSILYKATLAQADLEGADLTGADVSEATWSKTTCPDGTTSDDVGGTCENHLAPAAQPTDAGAS